MTTNQQNGYNAWAALGLQSPLDSSYGANVSGLRGSNPFSQQQAGLDRRINLQQAACAKYAGMLNSLAQRPEPKLNRAQRMAKEVREKNPGMQVQRRTRRDA